MRCPYCGSESGKVIDSRHVEVVNAIRRRRMCEVCGNRYNTFERVETLPLTVIKKDQTREPYQRSKIQDGMIRACYKRPIPVEKIQDAIDQVENTIFGLGEKEVSSNQIGELVMEQLKQLDEVSYVRVASVYREFKDVGTFMEELKKIMGDSGARDGEI